MKRMVCLLLAMAMMLFCLTACGEPKWKSFLAEYEALVDEYIELMEESDDPFAAIGEATDLAMEMAELAQDALEIAEELEDDPEALEEFEAEMERIAEKMPTGF